MNKQRHLDPTKDIHFTPELFVALQRFVDEVYHEHTSFKVTPKQSWFHKETHEPLNSKKKISQEKLEENYYRNLDIHKTEDALSEQWDVLALEAIKLKTAFTGVVEYNVEKGNDIFLPEPDQKDEEE